MNKKKKNNKDHDEQYEEDYEEGYREDDEWSEKEKIREEKRLRSLKKNKGSFD